MNRSFISSWIKTALPTISTYSMTSFASGRTTTITIDRTEPSMGRPHTSGSWQKPLPVCHLRLETLHSRTACLEFEEFVGARLDVFANRLSQLESCGERP